MPARTLNPRTAVLIAVLVAAVLLAPQLLASALVGPFASVGGLRDALPGAFAEHWRIGEGAVTRSLADAAHYWTAFHLVKAVAAALLVVVLMRARLRILAVLPLVVVLANLQGAVAPVSSLLSMLPADALRATADARGTTAFAALVHDFAIYHAAMVVLAAAATVAAVVAGVRAWRRDRRAVAVVLLAAAALAAVVTAANISTTADPEPALVAFLSAGA
ncbi:hypothetical protein GCM10022237_21180 [Nocardioides ginsengisoli]|uniref:Uncharacterized protein n=1 Tax=Nocardioides ginsengisoli TaxID=363868 RepID=A0ABW3W2N3_9ACTN